MSAVNHTHAAPTDASGTGLFASKDFEAGELIMRLDAEETICMLEYDNRNRACEYCLLFKDDPEDEDAEEIKLMKCSGCGFVKYCGEVSIAFGWSYKVSSLLLEKM
jgi:flavoprotein